MKQLMILIITFHSVRLQHTEINNDFSACPRADQPGVRSDEGIFCYHFENLAGIHDMNMANDMCKAHVDSDKLQFGGITPIITYQELEFLTGHGKASGPDLILIGLISPGYLYTALSDISSKLTNTNVLNLYHWVDLEIYKLNYWKNILSGDIQNVIKKNYTSKLLRVYQPNSTIDKRSEDWCIFLPTKNQSVPAIRKEFTFEAKKLYDAPCDVLFSLGQNSDTMKVACRTFKLHDSCKSPHPCGADDCVNTLAGYTCMCSNGFYLFIGENQRGQCSDINECSQCSEGECPCKNNGDCENLLGSYECNCPAQFTGDQCRTRKYNLEALEGWQLALLIIALVITVTIIVFFIFIIFKRRKLKQATKEPLSPTLVFPDFIAPSTAPTTRMTPSTGRTTLITPLETPKSDRLFIPRVSGGPSSKGTGTSYTAPSSQHRPHTVSDEKVNRVRLPPIGGHVYRARRGSEYIQFHPHLHQSRDNRADPLGDIYHSSDSGDSLWSDTSDDTDTDFMEITSARHRHPSEGTGMVQLKREIANVEIPREPNAGAGTIHFGGQGRRSTLFRDNFGQLRFAMKR